jgi:hypothetical protein
VGAASGGSDGLSEGGRGKGQKAGEQVEYAHFDGRNVGVLMMEKEGERRGYDLSYIDSCTDCGTGRM